MFSDAERAYVEAARVGRLATADADGRPNVVPFCFALLEDTLVTPLDDKPKASDVSSLRRVRDIRENPHVAAVIDDYSEEWSQLCWLQIRGRATLVDPEETAHERGVAALREKYDQYRDHAIEDRPLIRIQPGHVLSWGFD